MAPLGLSAQSVLEPRTGAAGRVARQSERVLQLWHLASLDAPTVAVVWAFAFAWTAGIHLQPWIPLLLGCGTWAVYVGDRVLDARCAIHLNVFDELQERHYFHWRHRAWLVPIAVCAASIACFLMLRLMPIAIRERDSVIAAAALAYFSGVHSPKKLPARLRQLVSKEFLVGTLFTAGCAAPVMAHLRSRLATSSEWPLMGSVVLFALLAWLNCAAIQAWESSEHRPIKLFAVALSAIAAIAGIALFQTYTHVSLLFCSGAVSALLISYLDRSRHRISPLTQRAFADLVLLTPAALLILRAPNA